MNLPKNHRCKLAKKLHEEQKLTQDETKILASIVRHEINFLLKHNILMTPQNYEKWFYVFCYALEHKKNLNDSEILVLANLFHTSKAYAAHEAKTPSLHYTKQLAQIASGVEKALSGALHSINEHTDTITKRQIHIKDESLSIKNSNIASSIDAILQEIENLRQQNEILSQELRSYHHDVVKLQKELQLARNESQMDFLTSLPNRRRFERALQEMLDSFKEKDYPFSLILFDIDNFKSVNDTYGHPVGDKVLKEIALILKTFLRATNIPARVGGEEFAILVPGSNIEEGVAVAQRIRNAIESRSISIDETTILHITASFGVTDSHKEDTIDSIFARADKALYKAKHNGKNQVVVIE